VAGIFVQPGDSVDPSVAAIALAPPATGNGTLDVPAAELPRIAVGDLVRVRTGGRAFAARISGVVPAVNPATGLAVVDLRGLPAGLPAGSPLDATIITGSVRGLVVPDGALLEDPQSGATIVFVRTRQPDGSFRFESRPIGVDVRAGGLARVTRGLRAGERVAVQGSIDLLAPAGAGP
ncbi:MAG TPA: hypothetical protein VJP76_00760, partial [Candidatus Tumulicola sp.]|nr:hypothetical protein [Candidatus Tumulicola sp.]